MKSLSVFLEPSFEIEAQMVFLEWRPFLHLSLFICLDHFWTGIVWPQWSIYSILATSRLNNCSVMYVGVPWNCHQKLQPVQNAAAGLLKESPSCKCIISILKALNWSPLCYRIHFKALQWYAMSCKIAYHLIYFPNTPNLTVDALLRILPLPAVCFLSHDSAKSIQGIVLAFPSCGTMWLSLHPFLVGGTPSFFQFILILSGMWLLKPFF